MGSEISLDRNQLDNIIGEIERLESEYPTEITTIHLKQIKKEIICYLADGEYEGVESTIKL